MDETPKRRASDSPQPIPAFPVTTITDWYIPASNPLEGYAYPGPVTFGSRPDLQKTAIQLLSQAHEVSQDHRSEFVVRLDGHTYRVHRVTTVEGDLFVMRKIPGEIPHLSALQLHPAIEELLLHERLSAGGLILVCGETGQGKSTTCAATMRARMEKFGSFGLTVEDPPEFPLHGPHGARGRCIQTDVQSGNFAEALRNAMRCYPVQRGSVLFVGETRDAETAGEVLRVATNGHLVFTTIHGTDIVASIKRLISLASADRSSSEEEIKAIIASSLRLVLHQKLRDAPMPKGQEGTRKKLEFSFLMSPDASTPVANRIRKSIDQIVSDIDQQKTILELNGAAGLLNLWK